MFHARIPVVRFVAEVTVNRSRSYIKCDLVPYRVTAVQNSAMIRAYVEWDSSGKLRDLLLVVKRFAKSRGIADASSGFLSSYAWVLFTLHVLLHHGFLPTLSIESSQAGFHLNDENVQHDKLDNTPISVLFFLVLRYFDEFDIMTSTATLRGFGEVSIDTLNAFSVEFVDKNCLFLLYR